MCLNFELWFLSREYTIFSECICLLISQRMGSFGCLGKTSRYTSGRYMFAGSIRLKCGTPSMGSGVATVQVVAKIMTRGIKIRS